MIKSMTGYGNASGNCCGLALKLELKSVNNRYLDCAVRLPRSLLFAEDALKRCVQSHISRGRVDLFITVEGTDTPDAAVCVNETLAKSYAAAIGAVAEQLDIPSGLTALDICRLPDVLSVEKRELDAEAAVSSLSALCEEALRDFDGMRIQEGEKLHADIAARLDTVEALVSIVEQRSPETVREYRERLYKKMCEVLESAEVDEQRSWRDAAVFAESVAVVEETVRLRSHVAQMRGMLETGSPIGRKMDFLVQEFNREANTIGSKCSDSEITKSVVALKGEIEKIREQVQNIE